MRATGPWRRRAFVGLWALGTAGLGWQVARGGHAFNSGAGVALPILLACTGGLIAWLAGGAPGLPGDEGRTRRGRLALLVALAAAVLFPLRTLVGPPLLFGFPALGLVVMAAARTRASRRELAYATALATIAGVAGLGAGWIEGFSKPAWAGLQAALVLSGLPAGWGLLRREGLLGVGVGRSVVVEEGLAPGLTRMAGGIAIGVPWGLGLVALGAAGGEGWVRAWWQPWVAIQPAIAEEAWGRVLLVPLAFSAFRTTARAGTALHAAVVVVAYWFAYLHTPGGFGAAVSTAMIGTLYALPVSYLWLWRGLETAIGFHFCVDFLKFLAAYLSHQGGP